jgi:hypothetical protein
MALTPDEIVSRVAEFAATHRRTNLARKGVQRCSEFTRIDLLPQREWSNDDAALLAEILTQWLKQPLGKQVLRPLQAIALYEIAQCGGLIAPLRVGYGKTLISLLAPRILGGRRPLLVVPAFLRAKTKHDMYAYAEHWRIAANLSITTYDWLGRVQAKEYLNNLQPDCIILDEAHRVRNAKAAVTRRIRRYCETHSTNLIALSGTMIRKRLSDWAHLSDWALADGSPAPRKWGTIAHWGSAIDEGATLYPGVLLSWCADETEHVREAYRRRVISTPGVVSSIDGLPGVGLVIEPLEHELPQTVSNALERLTDKWELPDGWPIEGPLEFSRAERQLALGVYYRWAERPPDSWIDARRQWGRFVRHCVKYIRIGNTGLDTELDVALHAAKGELSHVSFTDDEGNKIGSNSHQTWRNVRDTFKPITEHIWIDDSIVKFIVSKAHESPPAIVWVESVAVGQKLELLGIPYYGSQARSVIAGNILSANPDQPIACSVKAIGQGHNLQAWSRAIVAAPTSDAMIWEQMLGRFHRDGQLADECLVSVAMLTNGHHNSWQKALEHAKYLEQITGQPQKLLQSTRVGILDE